MFRRATREEEVPFTTAMSRVDGGRRGAAACHSGGLGQSSCFQDRKLQSYREGAGPRRLRPPSWARVLHPIPYGTFDAQLCGPLMTAET